MRLIGAMALDPVTYEEVEADRGATGQALSSSSYPVSRAASARAVLAAAAQSMVFISVRLAARVGGVGAADVSDRRES